MKNRMKNYWDNRANTYSESIRDELCSFKKEVWKELIKKRVGGKKNIEALDLGTGPGFFAIIMSELGYNVTAVDCSHEMIQEAKENAKISGVNINFVEGDIENLDLPREKFDLIVCRNLTWTLRNPESTYEKWNNLIKKEGRLLIFDANWYLRLSNPTIQEEYDKIQRLLEDMGYKPKVKKEQKKECENIARKLPLTYEIRPIWDKKVLLDCGFKKVIIDTDINNKIYTEKEKISYKYSPMFCIGAFK